MKKSYLAILTPYDGGFDVDFPDLPGCVTTGESLMEAMDMATDAANLWLCGAEDQGIPIPDATSALPNLEKKQFCAAISVDTLKYRMQTDTRAVRKNVSLPAWMSTMAEKRGINCSQVLQDALRSRLTE